MRGKNEHKDLPSQTGAPRPLFIVTVVQFQELQVGRETLLMSNRSLAEDSLTRRPRLCNGKFQLAKKYRELSNLAAACWEKQSQLGELTGWWFQDLEGALGCSRQAAPHWGNCDRCASPGHLQGSLWTVWRDALLRRPSVRAL